MKYFLPLALVVATLAQMHAQVSGNINYQNQVRLSDNNINAVFPPEGDLVLSVKGLANVQAETYVAIFNATQAGKTPDEVNTLLDGRIDRIRRALAGKEGTEFFVDIISFVPVYEYEVDKKLFSKDTYIEIPKGFEAVKNIHIKYADPDLLNEILATCAKAEVYDLVRVDYFAADMEQVKKDMVAKAQTLLQEKLSRSQQLLGMDLTSLSKQMTESFRVVYPVEMYKSYQAYSNSSLKLKKNAQSQQVEYATTLYYQPVLDKEFDFVIQPVIVEPAIQVLYEIKLKVATLRPQTPAKEYFLISPAGELKKIEVNQ